MPQPLRLTFRIRTPVDVCLTYLTDMQKFASVHPVISKIVPVGVDTYRVHETLRVGPVPVSFTYRARVEADPATWHVCIRATVLGLTRVEMNFYLYPEGAATRVEETLTVTSPLPVRALVYRIFREQHTRLFATMERVSA